MYQNHRLYTNKETSQKLSLKLKKKKRLLQLEDFLVSIHSSVGYSETDWSQSQRLLKMFHSVFPLWRNAGDWINTLSSE